LLSLVPLGSQRGEPGHDGGLGHGPSNGGGGGCVASDADIGGVAHDVVGASDNVLGKEGFFFACSVALEGSFSSLFSLLKCPLFFVELPVPEARRGVGCEEEGARPKCDEWRIELTFFLLYESDLLDYRRGAPRGVPSYAGPRLRL